MRRSLQLSAFIITGLIVLLFAALPGLGNQPEPPSSPSLEGSFIPDQILIGLKPGLAPANLAPQMTGGKLGIASLDSLNQRHRVQQVSALFNDIEPGDLIAARLGLNGVFKLTLPPGTDIFAAIAEYQADPSVAYAEPNRIYRATEIPNDTDFSKQWNLHNTGQTGGKADADIDAPEAWDLQKGKPSVMIAIVDTGVDYNHPELTGGRVRIDLDRDFINNDNDAMDDHGHGTYCAGIAAASTNNARGIAGICQGCQILPVKVLDSEGSGDAESVSKGIQYAAQAGAKVISMSLGYPAECGCSRTVALTINYAYESGSLLIAASGNEYIKSMLSYPAASPRVLSVGASDHKDLEADFSNRSPALDIMAPGKDIYSLNRNNSYRSASGTSAAAPHVSGVAGLVWSTRPELTNAQVWYILYHSADNFLITGAASTVLDQALIVEIPQQPEAVSRLFIPVAAKSRFTFGRLNAYKALTFSSPGSFYAPPDTCPGEPTCPPGCGAEITLAGDASALSDLRLLRQFRDDVLADTSLGREWIDLYQQHRLESALILAHDASLREQTRQALADWLPLFAALVDPEASPPREAVLTLGHAQALEVVVAGLAERGSQQMASDLARVRTAMQVERFTGLDIREAWQELNSVGP
jgi:subtilisin family serine protease